MVLILEVIELDRVFPGVRHCPDVCGQGDLEERGKELDASPAANPGDDHSPER